MAASQYNNKTKSLLQWKGITKKRKDYFQLKILNSVVFTEVVKPKISGESCMKNRRKYNLVK